MSDTTTNVPTEFEVDDFILDAREGRDGAVLQFLDKFGAGFIDSRNRFGSTALSLAVAGCSKSTVALLLEKGACIEARIQGRTVLENAEEFAETLHDSRFVEIADLLRQWTEGQQKKKELAEQETRKALENRAGAIALREARLNRLKQLRPKNSFLKQRG